MKRPTVRSIAALLSLLAMFAACGDGATGPAVGGSPAPWPEPAETDRHYIIGWEDEIHLDANAALHEITDGRHHHLHELAVSRVRVPGENHEEWLRSVRGVVDRFAGELHPDVSLLVESRVAQEGAVEQSAEPPGPEPALPFPLPNDPFTNLAEELRERWKTYTFQEALGPFEHPTWGINAFEAWSQQTDCQGVRIMTIDSGVDLEHPDLEQNLWVNVAERDGEPGVDDDGNGFPDDVYGWNVESNDNDVQDTNGHGTQTSGVIGARGGNAIGGSGVCQRASLLTTKWRNNRTGSRSHTLGGFLQALEYALANDVDIINQSQSWYCSTRPDQEGCWFNNRRDPNNQATDIRPQMALVEEAVKLVTDAGILFFTSYGNNSDDMDSDEVRGYPQDFDGVYGVIGTQGNMMFPRSNYGRGADFAAPASREIPFVQVTPFLYGSRSDGRPCASSPRALVVNHYQAKVEPIDSDPAVGCYADYWATSAASPLVAGVAALVWSANPELSASEVIEILRTTGRFVPALEGRTRDGKIVDAAGAVREAISRR